MATESDSLSFRKRRGALLAFLLVLIVFIVSAEFFLYQKDKKVASDTLITPENPIEDSSVDFQIPESLEHLGREVYITSLSGKNIIIEYINKKGIKVERQLVLADDFKLVTSALQSDQPFKLSGLDRPVELVAQSESPEVIDQIIIK